MTSQPKISGAIGHHWIATVSAAGSILVGALVLAGRLLDIPLVSALVFGSMTLKANTGLCFVLCGVALALLRRPSRHGNRVARACMVVAATIAVLSMLEYVGGWNFGIDELLVRDLHRVAGSSLNGRISPNSSLCFLLTAIGLWLMSRPPGNPRRPLALSWLGSSVVGIGLFAVLGYGASFTNSYGWWHFTRTSMYSSPLFVLLGSSLFAFAWREAGMKWLIGRWVTAGFAVGLTLLAVIAAFSHRSLKNLADATDGVRHTHEIVAKLGDMRSRLAATAGAGAEPHDEIRDILQQVEGLRVQISGNPDQPHEFDLMEKQISAEGVNGENVASIRAQLREMEKAEHRRLEESAAQAEKIAERAFVMLPVGTVLSLILVMRGLFWLNGEMAARQRGADALRQSEAWFRSIFNEASVPMCVAMPDGRYTQANPAFCKLTGYTREELLKLNVLEITHPDDRITMGVEPLKKLVAGTIPSFRGEKRYLHKNGSVVWTDINVSVVHNSENQPAFLVAQSQDITGRKRAAEALSKSEEERALAIEAGQLGIWSWDHHTRTLVWNERCNMMTGRPHDAEISHVAVMNLIHPDERARVHAEAVHALKNKEEIELEYRTLWPDGTVRWVQARGRAFKNANGKLVRIIGIMQDVTERREAEEALRKFNTELESLVQERTEVIQRTMLELRAEIGKRRRLEEEILGISERAHARIGQDLHDDLGQQLVGIALHLQLLSTQLSAEAHPSASEATKLKGFLIDSIGTTRNLARSLYPVELERGGLILSLQDLAHRTELMSRAVCTLTADEEFRFEKAAEIHLYRIVQESIGNALKHGKARQIAIECGVRDGVSTLTVTDNGSGFDRADDEKIRGMGLHLFQYRARLIGATITVSRGQNGGCVVTCAMGQPSAMPDPAVTGREGIRSKPVPM